MSAAKKTPPPNHRPYQPASVDGRERFVYTTPPTGQVFREVLRQIGWHGFSGAFYALDEDPSQHEPAGFSPLWLTVDTEPVVMPDSAEGAAR